MLERLFRLKESGTTVRTEVIGGATTFLTMAYIIFVQPAVLSACGMDFGSVMVATCVSSAIACVAMALMANYPVALAPAMGHNFFFAYTVVIGMKVPWQVALGAVFIASVVFIATASFGLREKLITAVPDSLKHAIAVGIGLLIAFVGLQWSGIVVGSPATLVKLGDLHSRPVLLSIGGFSLIAILSALRVRGAILWGILATAIAGIPLGIVKYQGLVSHPPSIAPTLFKLDIGGAFHLGLAEVIFVFFFLALFDTVGTLIGVGSQAGLMKDGTLPRARQALLADAIGSATGAVIGTSTVTSYIESAAGVSAGAKTGLANMVTALLLLLSLFFSPLVHAVGGGYQLASGSLLYPVTAPALVIIGCLMAQNVTGIKWSDITEAVPAFLTIVIMPMALSITEGIAFGIISYTVLKAISGKAREIHWLIYVFAVLFIARYAFINF